MDAYIKSLQDLGKEKGGNKKNSEHLTQAKANNWVKVIEQIYRLNLDNRILNNLR